MIERSVLHHQHNDVLDLIEISSLPLQSIETSFAVDSSGFTTCRFVQWVKAKYTDPKLMEKHQWVKVHLMCGVKTNVVTSVEVTDSNANDCPQFEMLAPMLSTIYAISPGLCANNKCG